MAEVKTVATRASYGEALVELGKKRDDFIVLDADLAAATQTGKFKKEFPERFYDCGIAEQNFECTPEAKSSLGKGFLKGGCRNHDLLMEGDKDCIIGIEAKVSESFDKDMEKILDKQKKKYNDNETKTRAYKLRRYLVKEDNQDVDKIGYQLFTATRATINSAIDNKKKKCVIIILFRNSRFLNALPRVLNIILPQ